MSEMLERLARAIYDSDPVDLGGRTSWTECCLDFPGFAQKVYTTARAALVELRTPTEAMLQTACDTHKVGEPIAGTALQGAPRECPHIMDRRRIWSEMMDEAL